MKILALAESALFDTIFSSSKTNIWRENLKFFRGVFKIPVKNMCMFDFVNVEDDLMMKHKKWRIKI